MTFLSCLLLLIMSSLTIYFTLRERLLAETQARLQSTVVLASRGIDTDAFKRLLAKLPASDPPETFQREIEASPEYRSISDYLNFVRDTDPGVILYAYTLLPTEDANTARFVVDADVQRLRKTKEMEGSVKESISYFGRFYDIKLQPLTRRALDDHSVNIEKSFILDEEFKTYSMMGFAPIIDRSTGQFLAILGCDISDRNFNRFISGVFNLTILVSVGFLFFIIMLSFFISSRLSLPLSLFAEHLRLASNNTDLIDVNLRTNIQEVIQLMDHYNTMVGKTREAHRKVEAEQKVLEHFVPNQALALISRRPLEEIKLGDALHQYLTVARCEFNFGQDEQELFEGGQTCALANELFLRTGPIVRKHGGLVIQYYASGFLYAFTGPVSSAVNASIELARDFRLLGRERLSKGFPAPKVSIGLHRGIASLGVIGEPEWYQLSIVSDIVPIAHDVSIMGADWAVTVVGTNVVLEALEDRDSFLVRQLGCTAERGGKKILEVYEFFDADESVSREKKLSTRTEFEKAVASFNTGSLSEANLGFKNVLAVNQQDSAALRYLYLSNPRSSSL